MLLKRNQYQPWAPVSRIHTPRSRETEKGMSSLWNHHTNTLCGLIIIFPITVIHKRSSSTLDSRDVSLTTPDQWHAEQITLITSPRHELTKPEAIYHDNETFLRRCRKREECHSWFGVRNLVTLKAESSQNTISDSWQAFPSYESDSYKKLLSRYPVTLSDFQNLDLEQSNSGIALFNSVILVTHVIITCKETLTLIHEVN